MDKMFENDNITVLHDGEISALIVSWDRKCANILDTDISEELNEIKGLILDMHIHKLVINLEVCQFFFTKEKHSWSRDTMYSLFKDLPVRKLGIVVPENIFTHAGFEAGIHSMSESMKNVNYFKKADQAIEWLKSL